MNRHLRKLIKFARDAYVPSCSIASEQAPFGFATRVAARWAAEGRQPTLLQMWQRLCWWGATVSVLICLLSAAYRSALPEPNAFDLLLEQPVTESDSL